MKIKLLAFVGLLMTMVPLWAAQFCVQSSSDLTAALSAAGNNSETDFIRIEQGLYTVPAGGFLLDNLDEMDISISGDWVDFFGNPCGQQFNGNAFNTILDGGETEQILEARLYGEANVKIANLFFANASNVTANVGGRGGAVEFKSTNGFQGEILIENNAFINNTADFGAAISVLDGDLVTIKNNLFTINTSTYCCVVEIYNANQTGVYIINNTIYQNINIGNDPGFIGGIGIFTVGTSQAFVANNIFWENDFDDIIFFGDGFRYLKNNNIEDLGGTVDLSANNISADPNFEVGIFNYTPAAGSLMINAGLEPLPIPVPTFDQQWNVGTDDLVGDARVKMGAVDIGAVESAQVDVIFKNDFEIIL